MLGPNEIEFFLEHGYIIVQDAYHEDELQAFYEILWMNIYSIFKNKQIKFFKHDTISLEQKCNDGLKALRHYNSNFPTLVQAAISRSPEYFRLCSSPRVMSAIRSIINRSSNLPLYLTNNGIIFTFPNDTHNKRSSNIELDWHKDTFYTIPRSSFYHVWSPLLHDATESIGTLQVCPGSHKAGIGKQKVDVSAQYDHRYRADTEEIKRYKPISIELKRGQALIFDSCLLHRSGKNISNNVRCTLIGLHHDATKKDFAPLSVAYYYTEQTPESYFYEIFGDKKIEPLLFEQAFPKNIEY